jgi:HEAT repeat protein
MIQALVQIGAPVGDEIIVLLKDKDPDIRKKTAKILDQLNWNPKESETEAWYKVAKGEWDGAIRLGAVAAEPLVVALIGKYKSLVGNDSEIPYGKIINALGQLGSEHAVIPLIGILKQKSSFLRKDAMKALVTLYQSGQLDEEHQRLILAQRNSIKREHVDKDIHSSSDCSTHKDTYIGIDFPV